METKLQKGHLELDVAQLPEALEFGAKGVWQGGLKMQIRVRDLAPFVLDEPKEIGGENAGPAPLETLMAAHIECTAVTFMVIAEEMGFDYSGLEIEAACAIDPKGFLAVGEATPEIKVVTTKLVVATTEPPERLQAVQAAYRRRCPVYTTFRRAGVEMKDVWKSLP
ncbi:MAG: OsmC family protein [Chloroflexota bacterium]|nr:OsmC family protein [Chloroflexota bacterium]